MSQDHISITNLDAKLATYIHNRNWNFPEAWKDLFPFLEARIVDIVLPLNVRKDQLVRPFSNQGILTLKEAYTFNSPNLPWAKTVWNIDIHPSKSLLA